MHSHEKLNAILANQMRRNDRKCKPKPYLLCYFVHLQLALSLLNYEFLITKSLVDISDSVEVLKGNKSQALTITNYF